MNCKHSLTEREAACDEMEGDMCPLCLHEKAAVLHRENLLLNNVNRRLRNYIKQLEREIGVLQTDRGRP